MVDAWLRDFVLHALQVGLSYVLGFVTGRLFRRVVVGREFD